MRPTSRETDRRIEEFEAACLRGERPSAADYLPPPDHPEYSHARRELVAIDREFAEARGDRPPDVTPPPVGVIGWLDRAEELYRRHCRPGAPQVTEVTGDAPAPPKPAPDEPRPGETLFGFRLIRLLGRGTFGRVYLAEQPGLAHRLVALKVGADLFDESQTLAELQHANIMPVYSLHRDGDIQGICMPYLGSYTLADVLHELKTRGGDHALAATLDRRAGSTRHDSGSNGGPDFVAAAPRYPSLELLRQLDHERGVLWVLARLAEGLAHAHERGIVHRDLKPANVLLADDGTPMLLDFNLSDRARAAGDVPAVVGGTLPYMSPEQLAQFGGERVTVDARSDLYSLGLLGFELLAGTPPVPVGPGPIRERVSAVLAARRTGLPRLRMFAPACSAAAESILARCLEFDPSRRYASAADLRDDLQRQLDDRPLLHAPEGSAVEAAAKFARRNPRLLGVCASALLGGALLVAGIVAYRRDAQATALDRIAKINTVATSGPDARLLLGLTLPERRDAGEAKAREAIDAYRRLPAADRDGLRREAAELLLLLARAERLRAVSLDGTPRSNSLGRAKRFNAEAAELTGPTRGGLLQRALIARLDGYDAEAERLRAEAAGLPAGSARERYELAGELLTQGKFRQAREVIDAAVRLDPADALGWMLRAHCSSLMGNHADAAHDFDVCVALRPGFAPARVWRGKARLSAGDVKKAVDDFDDAIAMNDGDAEPLVLRGLARLRLKKFAEAGDDFTAALRLDPDHTRLYFLRALARAGAGDEAGAASDRRAGLASTPGDALSYVARGVARLPAAPADALADFREAMRLDPSLPDAAQNAAHVLSDHLGNNAEAVAVLDRLLENAPDLTDARIGRAVLLARLGEENRALADVDECLKASPSARVLYQAACAHARLAPKRAASRAEAISLLRRSLEGGFGADLLATDPDLEAIRGDEAFKELSRKKSRDAGG